MSRNIVPKLLQGKKQRKTVKAARKTTHYPEDKTIWRAVDLSSETRRPGGNDTIFLKISFKKENSLRERTGNEDILGWRKNERICHQRTCPEWRVKEASPDRKAAGRRNREKHHDGGEMKAVNKGKGRCDRCFSFWVSEITFAGWSKDYNADVVLKRCRNIQGDFIRNWEGRGS